MVFDWSVCSSRAVPEHLQRQKVSREPGERIKYLLSNLHGLLVPQQWCFMAYFPPGKEEMGWHPTIFSTLCCITSKLALHGNKLSPKANNTFLHSTVSVLLAQESVILTTNLFPLHQFLNIYGVTHRHKTGFPITPTLHVALNLGQDVTLAANNLFEPFPHEKTWFLIVQTERDGFKSLLFPNIVWKYFLIAPILSPRSLQNKQYHLFQSETMFCSEISNKNKN